MTNTAPPIKRTRGILQLQKERRYRRVLDLLSTTESRTATELRRLGGIPDAARRIKVVLNDLKDQGYVKGHCSRWTRLRDPDEDWPQTDEPFLPMEIYQGVSRDWGWSGDSPSGPYSRDLEKNLTTRWNQDARDLDEGSDWLLGGRLADPSKPKPQKAAPAKKVEAPTSSARGRLPAYKVLVEYDDVWYEGGAVWRSRSTPGNLVMRFNPLVDLSRLSEGRERPPLVLSPLEGAE